MRKCKQLVALVIVFSLLISNFAAFAAASEPVSYVGTGTGELNLKLIGRYSSGQEGGAEIVTYDPDTKQAFVANGAAKALDILDLSTLESGQDYTVIDRAYRVTIADLGLGVSDITSVAVNPDKGIVAVAVPAETKTDNGMVVFIDSNHRSVIKSVYVGALPDMVTFTPDGNKLLVANEGEPNDDYTDDPVGSVSIIDITNGAENSVVNHVYFDGVSYDDNVRIFGKDAAPVKDFEPEYIAAEDDSTAYVVLQENNAMAKLDIVNKRFTHIYGLGFKDHSVAGNGLDASDKDSEINIRNWPVLGMYQPDGIDVFTINGTSYVLTANEGDSRDYGGYSEEGRVKDIIADIQLKAENYDGYTQQELDDLVTNGLFNDNQLGRLKITTANGKKDGKYEALYSYGARSFSIWQADNFTQVYDSGDDFEKITAAALPQHFNSDNSEATLDTRSDDKGPEPEAVVVGQVDGKHYAFIGLERVGGIMVYNISNPQAPEFVTYYNSRDFSADIAGDVAPEGLKFILAADSPTGNPLLLAACEVSGTVAVYEVTGGGQPEGWDLTVMHTNDTHAHLDNIAHRATAVSKIRDEVENSLLLDAGDVFSGTLYFTQFQGQADLELMNLLGYDAMGLGNHEFDKGPEGLAKFITGNYPEGYKTPAQFPVVNANFDFSNEPVLKDLAHTTVGEQGADNLDGQIYPAVILDVNGEKVGVIGVATEDTAFISSPGDNIEINDAFEAAEEAVTMLESKGINKIVAISHLGWDRDLQLAEEVEGIDIVVGGHSHTKPDQYPALVDKDSTPTVVVQAKDHGEFLGRLDVTFDDHGVIISSVGSLLAVKDYAADAATSARLAEYAAVLDDFKTTVVGSTQVALDGLRANVRTKETNLGNLIADAMLAKASGTGATIAITNAGGIRASIDEGDITLGEVLTVMPFGNTLTVLELTGEQIVAALENGVSKVPAQEGRFPQVAGLKFVYDPAQPENSRMISVLVKTANGYQPIDRQAKYMVATNSFMAGGGDFYTMFKEAGRVIDMGNVDYEVFKEYLEKHSPVNPQVEGRIQTGTKETKPFAITASQLDRTSGIKAKVTVNRTEVEDHAGSEVVIFQLMKGTMPVSIVALEKDIRTSEELIAHFNETGDQFLVKAFVFDEFNSDTHSVQTNLAQPQVLQ